MSEKEEKILTKPKRRKITLFILIVTVSVSTFVWKKNYIVNQFKEFIKPRTYRFKATSKKEEENFSINIKNINILEQKLIELLEKKEGEYAIYFNQPNSDLKWNYQENKVFEAASVNKIFVMVAFLQEIEKGTYDLKQQYTMISEDFQGYGTGDLHYQSPGYKITYEELLLKSGKISDNTAAYILHKQVGFNKMKEKLEEWGMEKTSIEKNTTTAKEVGEFLNKIVNNELINSHNKKILYSALTKTDFEKRIPQGVPAEIQVVHKIGNKTRIYHDCGIVLTANPYVLCVLTQDLSREEAFETIPQISQLIYTFIAD